jgi:hypothetical protein
LMLYRKVATMRLRVPAQDVLRRGGIGDNG